MRRRVRPIMVVLLGALFLLPQTAGASTPAPVLPRPMPAAIEPLAPYQGQTLCDPHTRSGTAALARLLRATYSGTSTYTTYACGSDGSQSEHYDGRAIDWMVSVRDATQHADGDAFIAWLLATDSAGNRFAMARRLGVMYVIFNNRIWGSWEGQWEDYNGCSHLPQSSNDNACHRTHVHISLDWNGGLGDTTFWRGRVFPVETGPCPGVTVPQGRFKTRFRAPIACRTTSLWHH